MDQGFGAFFGFLDPYDACEKFPRNLWEGRKSVKVSGYADDLFTDRAIEFLGKQGDTRFLLVVSYTAPHFAIAAPADEVERHRGRLPETDPARR